MNLPPGWYPREKNKIADFLKPFEKDRVSQGGAKAVVAPHAGWYYSGKLAALAIAALDPGADTVAVIGGHLPPTMPLLAAFEEAVKTPLGSMAIDGELLGRLEKLISLSSDRYQDNTVEVLLPMAHYFFPGSKFLWLRFPAELSSFEAGKILSEAAGDLGRRLAVIASTDLTHYGANYAFSPKGSGKAALEWVKNSNDAAFINAVLDGDPAMVLKRANEDQSSCSPGAVLGALGFSSQESKKPRLLKYQTSADIDDTIPDSFVGYAAISL